MKTRYLNVEQESQAMRPESLFLTRGEICISCYFLQALLTKITFVRVADQSLDIAYYLFRLHSAFR